MLSSIQVSTYHLNEFTSPERAIPNKFELNYYFLEFSQTWITLSISPPLVWNWGERTHLSVDPNRSVRFSCFVRNLHTHKLSIATVRSGRPKPRSRQSNIQLIIDIWGTQFNKSPDVGFTWVDNWLCVKLYRNNVWGLKLAHLCIDMHSPRADYASTLPQDPTSMYLKNYMIHTLNQ